MARDRVVMMNKIYRLEYTPYDPLTHPIAWYPQVRTPIYDDTMKATRIRPGVWLLAMTAIMSDKIVPTTTSWGASQPATQRE